MATNSIKISYPKSGHVRGRSFAAYGKTERDVGHIKGVLKNRQGVVVQTGKTLSEGPNWVVTFEDVGPGDYTLEVSGVGATPDTSMFHVEGEVAVGVTYPPNGTTLDNAFVASGASDQSYAVSGQIVNSAGVYFGTTLQGPPASQTWYIQFTGVPGGNNYTLTVSDTEGFGTNAFNLIIPAR